MVKEKFNGFMDMTVKGTGPTNLLGVVYSNTETLGSNVYHVQATYLGRPVSFGEAMEKLARNPEIAVSCVTSDGRYETFDHVDGCLGIDKTFTTVDTEWFICDHMYTEGNPK